jgi:non-ribosomal peptide synthetase component E (peptide arylation enzyme)
MNILEIIKTNARSYPLFEAMRSEEESLNYQELDQASDYLASYIQDTCV